MALHLVKTGPKRRASRASDPKPATMLQCPRCGGREIIETKVGVLYAAGKAKGGTKSLLCADCHRRGERVVLV